MNDADRDRSPLPTAAGERIEPYQDALAWLRRALGGPPGWWHAAYAMVMAAADAEQASLRADRDRWRSLAFHYEMVTADAEASVESAPSKVTPRAMPRTHRGSNCEMPQARPWARRLPVLGGSPADAVSPE